MIVVTQSWIIVTLTIGCEKFSNSRQHSRKWVGNCVNDNVGKKATHASRTKDILRFLSVAFGFRFGRWKARYVSEFFHFLKFVLKGVVSIFHRFRSTGQPGRINGFDRCFQVVDRCTARCHRVTPVLAKTQILKFYQPHMGKQKPQNIYHCPNVCESCRQFIPTNLFNN